MSTPVTKTWYFTIAEATNGVLDSSFNVCYISTSSSLSFLFNIDTVNTIGKISPIKDWNEFDEFGSLLSLQRKPEEKNFSFRRRILDTYFNMANSSYKGMINGITRELGCSLFESIEINPRVDGAGHFLAPDPCVIFDGAWLLLYSDYAAGSLDWAIDRLQNGGNFEHTGRLVDFINTTAFFTASLRPGVDYFNRSSTILNQTNRLSVPFEYVQTSTKFKLEKYPIVRGSIFFSNPNIFRTEKDDISEVLSAGHYYIDYNDGIVTTFSTPDRKDHVRYQYTKYPFYALGSPVVIHDINSESFKVKMFDQIFSTDVNDYINGTPTELGVDIINELLSISPMYWGV